MVALRRPVFLLGASFNTSSNPLDHHQTQHHRAAALYMHTAARSHLNPYPRTRGLWPRPAQGRAGYNCNPPFLYAHCAALEGVPVVFVSAARGTGMTALVECVARVARERATRVPTRALNELLRLAVLVHRPPVSRRAGGGPSGGGTRLRLRFMQQTSSSAPC